MAHIKEMKKYIATLILLTAIIAAGSLAGQQRRKLTDVLRPSETSLSGRKTGIPAPPRNLKIVAKDDTLFCTATLQIASGWQIPRDTLTEAMAKGLTFSIRLSNKNKKGHFCRLEILGYDLQPGSYTMTPNFVELLPEECRNPDVSTLDISRMDMISDADGDRVMETRSYDQSGTLLLTEAYREFGKDVFKVGTLSALGLPVTIAHMPDNPDKAIREIVMCPDSTSTCSFFVSGGEPVALDDKGTYYIRREEIPGLCQTVSTLGKDMKPVISKKGYASEVVSWCFAKGDSVMYVDADGNPMNVAEDALIEDIRGVAKAVRKYDERHKLTEIRFYDKEGRPAENLSGVHKMTMEYDRWGNQIRQSYLDLQEEPVKNGVARYELVCDSLGRRHEFRAFDHLGQPCNNGAGLSRFFNIYDSAGRQTNFGNYSVVNGEEVLTSGCKTENGKVEFLYEDGGTKTELYDQTGRMVRAESKKDGKLDTDFKYPLILYNYQDRDGGVVSEELAYNPHGTLAYREIRDSLARTSILEWFDSTGTCTQRYMRDENVPGKMTYSFLNSFLSPARTANMNGVFGYKLIFKPTLRGEWSERYAYDEFNEPDYNVSSFGEIAHGVIPGPHNSGDESYIDEYMNRIDDMEAFKTSKAKAISVEIRDSMAYDLGFKDNDLILSYGPDFRASAGETEGVFLAKWGVAEVLAASKGKKVKVFRVESINPEKCSIVELDLPVGTTRDFGIATYQRYLTDKQAARIAEAGFRIESNEEELAPWPVVVNMPIIPYYTYGHEYEDLVGSPSILLWVGVVEYPEMCWMNGESFDLLDKVLQLVRTEAGLHLRTCNYDGRKTIINENYLGHDVRLLEGHVNYNTNCILNIFAEGEYSYEKGNYKALATHLAHTLRDTDLSSIQSREDMLSTYSKMFKIFQVLHTIKDKAPEEFLEGQVYMGYYAGVFGLKNDLLMNAFLRPAMEAGVIKSGRFDLSYKIYSILSEDAKTDAGAAAELAEFMKDKVYVYTVLEEPGKAAYDKGLRGEYVLLRSEDWTMFSPERWEDMRDRLKDANKHIYLMDPKGKIIETDIEGTMGVAMTLRSVDPKEYERIRKLVKKVSKDLKRK